MSASSSVKPSAAPPRIVAASTLNFRATRRNRSGVTLGTLIDASGAPHHLVIAADGRCSMMSALPPGHKPILLHESAANVLRGGMANPDGSISYQGDAYRIESSFDGTDWAARVSGGC